MKFSTSLTKEASYSITSANLIYCGLFVDLFFYLDINCQLSPSSISWWSFWLDFNNFVSIDVTNFYLRFMLAIVLSIKASSSSRIGSYSRRFLCWIANILIIWSSSASSIVLGGRVPLDFNSVGGDICVVSFASYF